MKTLKSGFIVLVAVSVNSGLVEGFWGGFLVFFQKTTRHIQDYMLYNISAFDITHRSGPVNCTLSVNGLKRLSLLGCLCREQESTINLA